MSCTKERETLKVNDICIYSYDDCENASLAVVKIVRFLMDDVAEVAFLDVLIDDTGNGFFDYLLNSGKTMNVSPKYLKKCHGDFLPYK